MDRIPFPESEEIAVKRDKLYVSAISTDAVKSWRDLERRREILKDSHVGSFAVIGIVLLMIAQFALFASAPETTNHSVLIFVPAVSRIFCGLEQRLK